MIEKKKKDGEETRVIKINQKRQKLILFEEKINLK
jgi:hypothetical protein